MQDLITHQKDITPNVIGSLDALKILGAIISYRQVIEQEHKVKKATLLTKKNLKNKRTVILRQFKEIPTRYFVISSRLSMINRSEQKIAHLDNKVGLRGLGSITSQELEIICFGKIKINDVCLKDIVCNNKQSIQQYQLFIIQHLLDYIAIRAK